MQAAIAKLDGLEINRKLFIHINNSNPTLQAGSVERKTAEAAGWQIPADGMEINL
jgi:pyrroloquinoline quinone biosynthesis protein B